MKNIKCQKGAISLFVMLAMLFFLGFMIGVFSITTRRNDAQLEAVRETAKIYSSGIDANAVYDSMVATSNRVVIPISTLNQLKEVKRIVDTNSTETINYTINGKLYTYSKNASYMLANDIILDFSEEIDNKSELTVYDYMLYSNDYNIELNNHNIYYRLSDGTLWKCIFYNNINCSGGEDNRFTVNNAGKSYDSKRYSILDNGVEEFKHAWSVSTNYEFLLTYNCYSGKFVATNYNRWRQNENPVKVSNSVTTCENITTTLGTADSWGGLAKSTTTDKTYLDGSIIEDDTESWFYPVGQYEFYDIAEDISIKAYTASENATECLLFVRAK